MTELGLWFGNIFIRNITFILLSINFYNTNESFRST
jgi:hypothetical protein